MLNKYIIDKQLHFGLDFLEIFGTFKNEESFNNLNFTNSNYGELGEYTYQKNDIKKYKYGISFSKNNYQVFSYVKGDPARTIPTKDCLTVYGVAFKILDIKEIFEFIDNNLTNKGMPLKLKRFDICIDLKDSIKNVLKRFKKIEQYSGNICGKNGEIETQYIGSPKKSINRRHLIRIYDKIKDLKGSKKEILYQDYFLEDNVTRIELEIRRNLDKEVFLPELLDNDFLKQLIFNYVGPHTDIFNNFAKEKVTLYRKPKIISDEEKQGIYYKNLYKSSFIGYAKNILNGGSCPVRILIGEGIIDGYTKKYFGEEKINGLSQLEREIRAKYSNLKKKKYEK